MIADPVAGAEVLVGVVVEHAPAEAAAVVDEVVVGVHVLQQVALLDAAHAAGGPGGVQFMGQLVGAAVEFVVIHRLVDPDAPEDDGGVVPVLGHHLLDVADGQALPGASADVLPARDLREDQEADLVAPVHKMLGLRVMGGPDGVEPSSFFRIRVQPLRGPGMA